jgi:hypothetical protein
VLAAHPSGPEVLRLPANVGYAGALAAVTVDTEFTAWLNDDAEPAADWLARLEDALDRRKDAAAAGSRMVAPDGSVISVGVGLTADGYGVDLVAASRRVSSATTKTRTQRGDCVSQTTRSCLCRTRGSRTGTAPAPDRGRDSSTCGTSGTGWPC